MIAQIQSSKSSLLRDCDSVIDEAAQAHRRLSELTLYRARRMARLRRLIDALDDPARETLLLLHADAICRYSAAVCSEGVAEQLELPDTCRALRTRYRYAEDSGPKLGRLVEDKRTCYPSLMETR